MTLGRVGSGLGPDITALRDIRQLSPATELYAAGGVRDADDLNRLHSLGLSGVLLASALHDGRLSADALDAYN
jgi:phosphoribosylformimino-5-aminoimidazole carboxamide ribotide isomerase